MYRQRRSLLLLSGDFGAMCRNELPRYLDIVLQVVNPILKIGVVILQERMHLQARIKTEHPLDGGLRQFFRPVTLKCERFERHASRIGSSGCYLLYNLVGNIERNPHKSRIAQT